MANRYGTREVLLTGRGGIYQKILDKRNVGFIQHYSTPELLFPETEEIANLNVLSHIWKEGDRFWKLSAQHYEGKAHLWWIIAWFNQTPTEGHLNIGDIVYVPLPLVRILDYLGV